MIKPGLILSYTLAFFGLCCLISGSLTLNIYLNAYFRDQPIPSKGYTQLMSIGLIASGLVFIVAGLIGSKFQIMYMISLILSVVAILLVIIYMIATGTNQYYKLAAEYPEANQYALKQFWPLPVFYFGAFTFSAGASWLLYAMKKSSEYEPMLG